MIKKLPLIELQIDPENESFVSAISIVSSPAIESSFIAFSTEQKTNNHFNFSDERMELIGIAMKANVPIYRNDPKVGEFAVVFSAETIREIAQTFFKRNFSANMNVEHSEIDADSFVFQSYIVDSSKGMHAPKGIVDANDGDWIVGVKVQSTKVWQEIKAGKIQGFSVEGIFDMLNTDTIIDFQFNNLKKDSQILEFTDELEAELDKIIKQFNL
ncbi:XkdF-like putative serine protease domain-containing protein [Pedobacter agri]|uniref:XkdF-like putative serine protease domain-containing protein n=1 Tax=Pedobacter agri TaxID=454586 RepID=UPI00292E06BF|nr:XkdF-like putative serine protease domain-containing protein [Pedobacter agri]